MIPLTKPRLGRHGIAHPARYSDELIPHFVDLLEGYHRVLDPFAGTGKIHQLRDHAHDTVGVELEPEWAELDPRTIVGDATALPFPDDSFDAICTSPTYGNRLADSHNARDPQSRRSYTHDLGRQLSENNSGAMQWKGPLEVTAPGRWQAKPSDYCRLHEAAWAEAVRVLRPGGMFVLNIKDHVRAGRWQDVTAWHLEVLIGLGLAVRSVRPVPTRSLRTGSTAAVRVGAEQIIAMVAP